MAMTQDLALEETRRANRNIRLGSLGAALEYYDFAVYLYVATLIGAAFFPVGSSPTLALVQTFSIFAIGYAIRPIAGILVGRVADKVGRKRLFVLTVTVMSLATLLIGLLPTYDQIGYIAPILLILLRIIQGCAVGAELPAAAVFVSEHAQRKGIARAGSFQQMMTFGGLLIGASVAFVCAQIAVNLTPGFPSLAWRLPFILGGVLGVIAMYLRRRLDESPVFTGQGKDERRAQRKPIREVLASHTPAVFFGGAVVGVLAIMNIAYVSFWPTYLQVALLFSPSTALISGLISIVAAMVAMPLWGRLADRRGWRFAILASTGVTLAGTVVLLVAVPTIGPDSNLAFWVQIPAVMGAAGLIAIVPGLVSSVFPAEVRQTGYAISYNIVIAILGGILTVLMVQLVAVWGIGAPMYVALIGCAIAILNAVLVSRVVMYLGAPAKRTPNVPAESKA